MFRLLRKRSMVKFQLLVGLMALCIVLIPTAPASAGVDLGCVQNVWYQPHDDWNNMGGLSWNTSQYLGYGSNALVVYELQKRLNRESLYGNIAVDGIYGWQTYNAVLNLQTRYASWGYTACGSPISRDGVVGPQVWTILQNY